MSETTKPHTSAAVKNRYNAKAYERVTVCVPKEEGEAFKAKCNELGISQAQVLKDAIKAFLSE